MLIKFKIINNKVWISSQAYLIFHECQMIPYINFYVFHHIFLTLQAYKLYKSFIKDSLK